MLSVIQFLSCDMLRFEQRFFNGSRLLKGLHRYLILGYKCSNISHFRSYDVC